MLEHFQKAGITILNVNGEQSIENVHQEIIDKVEPILNNENSA